MANKRIKDLVELASGSITEAHNVPVDADAGTRRATIASLRTLLTGAGAIGGDLVGPLATAVVDGLQTRPVAATAPASGDPLAWNGSSWTPGSSLSSSLSSGIASLLVVAPTISQSATAGYNALRINVTETSVGTGQKNLLALAVGGTDQARIDNFGRVYGALGDVANPGLSFLAAPTTGITVLNGNTELTLVRGGVEALKLNPLRTGIAGVANAHLLFVQVDQSGSAGYRGLQLLVDENTVGTGAKHPFVITVDDGTPDDVFTVSNLGVVTASGAIIAPAGSAASPAIRLTTADVDTGLYQVAADQLGIATGGVLRCDISTTAITSTLPLTVPAGTVTAPSIVFANDADSGLYSPAAAQVAIAINGAQRFLVTAGVITSSLEHYFPDGTATTPSISNTGDTNTGLYFPAADQVGISTGGAVRMTITTTLVTVDAASTLQVTLLDVNNTDALGGGAAATLGTIGGTGPATAAQNQWVQITVGGANRWIPVWA